MCKRRQEANILCQCDMVEYTDEALQIRWYVRIIISRNRKTGNGFLKINIILLLKYLTEVIDQII